MFKSYNKNETSTISMIAAEMFWSELFTIYIVKGLTR